MESNERAGSVTVNARSRAGQPRLTSQPQPDPETKAMNVSEPTGIPPTQEATDTSRSDAVRDYFRRKDQFLRRAQRERWRSASHEAGHAVFAVERRIDFVWVAIQPALPGTYHPWDWLDDDGEFDFGRVEIMGEYRVHRDDLGRVAHEQLIFAHAGPVAEARHLGLGRIRLVGDDLRKVKACLHALGRGSDRLLMDDDRDLARLFVDRHWPQIQALASALIDRRYLRHREVKQVVKRAGAKPKRTPPPPPADLDAG